VIIFGLVQFLSKKVTKSKFFLKKNRNRVKLTGFGSVWFFREKTGLAWFFSFGSIFSVWLGFGSGWLSFFRFFCRFRFGFFGFLLVKPKPNWPVFSKI